MKHKNIRLKINRTGVNARSIDILLYVKSMKNE
jgi:hypothetical protein